MRRLALRLAAVLLIGVGNIGATVAVSSAQTTPTTTTPTTPTTTPTSTPTTVATVATTTTTGAETTSTTTDAVATTEPVPVTTEKDSGSGGTSIPWIPVAAAVVVVGLVGLVAVARRRAAARRLATQWRNHAADATAEAGAVARDLSQGTAPTGQIAQQILASLRAFEELSESAPDASTRATADRGRRALQTLGLAIDADYRLRRAQPTPDPTELTRSEGSVRRTAEETDHTLRSVYRTFTGTD